VRGTDYQCDVLMHGLYYLLGSDLTHSYTYEFMYKQHTTPEILQNIYGRGFTVYGNLPEYLNDNSDLENRARAGEGAGARAGEGAGAGAIVEVNHLYESSKFTNWI